MQQFTTTFIGQEEVAEGTFKYLFTKPEGFEFIAGQYVVLEILDPQFTDERPSFRSLSMANAPHEDHIEFIMRTSDSAFKKSLHALTRGDRITIKGPLGHMRLPEDLSIPVVFLTAGVGITPARSMIYDALERKSPRDMTLIYANREVASVACFGELGEIDLPNYRCVHAISDTQEGWDGELRRVDEAFLRETIEDFSIPIFYIVGTTGFVNAMKGILEGAGVTEDKMMIDNFG